VAASGGDRLRGPGRDHDLFGAGIRELRRRNAELEATIEILKAAASFFVRDSDPRRR
jgi:hypothetical protein